MRLPAFSPVALSRSRLLLVVLLAAAGHGLQRTCGPAWPAASAAAARASSPPDGLSGELAVAALGGLRTLVADLCWLRAHVAWERADHVETERYIRFACRLDPAALFFWINGARVLAYDVPAWRIEQAGSHPLPSAARQRIHREQAERALALLAQARHHHPGSAAPLIEAARVHWQVHGDLAAAAAGYREAAVLPGAPYFAARLHAELLLRLGRLREARDWLASLYPTLPEEDPAALRAVVYARWQALEARLPPLQKNHSRTYGGPASVPAEDDTEVVPPPDGHSISGNTLAVQATDPALDGPHATAPLKRAAPEDPPGS